MTRVLIGQSYYLRFDPKLHRAMQPYPPLGSLWAAAHIRARGHDVRVFDAMLADSEQAWAVALERYRPGVAVLFEDSFNYLSKMCLLRMREAAFAMIDMARKRGCQVVVCGSDASDRSSLYLERGAHYVLAGEGEITLGELLEAMAGTSSGAPESIAGLRYLDGDGRVAESGPRPLMSDLDTLPEPAWDLVDLAEYRSIWRRRHGYFSLNMATTRGCPFHCNWCAKPIWGQTYNSRSPARVVAEMSGLVERYGVEHVAFVDDIMGLQPGWIGRFADHVRRAGLRVPYKCLSRADILLRDGEIEAHGRAGCQSVWIGAESGSQRILDAMEKGITVEQIEEATRRLGRSGIRAGFFLQFGYPGETREDIDLTRELVRRCAPDEIGISVSYPLPGTEFHRRVQEHLGSKRNWRDSEDLAMLYHGPFSSAFYRRLHRVVQLEFRRDRAAESLRAAARRPGKIRPHHLRRVGAAVVHSMRLPVERRRLERCAMSGAATDDFVAQRMSRTEAARPTRRA